jgi:peptidoglycan/LPS O-acetylase OafA/YrhL
VLTLPKRWFLPTMAAFVLFGLVFRIVCIMTDTSTMIRWVTLFGCLDSFAVGALVAYLRQTRILDKIPSLSRTVLMALPLTAFACFFLGRALMTLPENNLWLALTESVDAVFLAWVLIAASMGGVKGRYALLLSWAPLVYLGRISYGVYVYHVFVIIIFSPLLAVWGLSAEHGTFMRVAILFLLTVALASLSWHWLEQPFLAWKRVAIPRRRHPSVEALGPVVLVR